MLKLVAVSTKVMSLANSLQTSLANSNRKGKSLIKIKKNNGPSILPCGTPNMLSKASDIVLSILTDC
jgi:hypothetical protein